MNLHIADKQVVVTGGSKGIGLAIALQFAREGARPVLVSRNRDNLSHALSTFAAQALPTPEIAEIDLSKTGSDRALFNHFPKADILINNAGAIPGGSIHDISEEAWRSAWELKLFGYINLTRRYLGAMEDRGQGVICNIIGMAGVAPRYEYICGSVANGALIAFTNGIGAGSVRKGVRVFGINPSPTRSDRIEGVLKQQAASKLGDASRWQEMIQKLPFGRLAEPDEVAGLTVYCCSPQCGYLSGTVINVDGGQFYAPN
jgi:NAD(P)-dependent dehydrogenase (short-subunit alcohol dehydrogenase family)